MKEGGGMARIRRRGRLAALLAGAWLLSSLPTQAQEEGAVPSLLPPTEAAPIYPTALEAYLERPGILLVKRRHPLPAVVLQGGGEMRLEAVAAHEPGMQHQRMMGIRAELDVAGLAHEERILYIDVHEIPELVRAIGFMTSAAAQQHSQGGDRTEMRISTQDGLVVAGVFGAGGAQYFLRTRSTSFAVGPVSLTALRVALDQAREYLFSN
jgi:hypothetical protein